MALILCCSYLLIFLKLLAHTPTALALYVSKWDAASDTFYPREEDIETNDSVS